MIVRDRRPGTYVWQRFINRPYMFVYHWDDFKIEVYEGMYNPLTWEDEWVLKHAYTPETVKSWSKRSDK